MFNESLNIESTIHKIKEELIKENYKDYELVFVNEGSKDDTWEKAK